MFHQSHTGTRTSPLLPAYSMKPLLLDGDTLYGTTTVGTVFRMKTDGTGFNVLHSIGGNSSTPNELIRLRGVGILCCPISRTLNFSSGLLPPQLGMHGFGGGAAV